MNRRTGRKAAGAPYAPDYSSMPPVVRHGVDADGKPNVEIVGYANRAARRAQDRHDRPVALFDQVISVRADYRPTVALAPSMRAVKRVSGGRPRG